MRLDPRVALLFAIVSAASALSGPLPALVVLVLSLGLATLLGLGWGRFLPLTGSVGLFVLLVPVAPAPAGTAVAKGLAVSVAVLVAFSAARWDRLLAAMQAAGLPRTGVAFLAIVLSHLESTGRDAARAADGLALRGGFRGARGLVRSTPLILARTLRRAFERAERTAEALELRGFAGQIPTLPRLRIGGADVAAGAIAAAGVVVALASRLP